MANRYRVTHRTRYRYSDPVSLCHNEACLLARDTPGQVYQAGRLDIDPAPALLTERRDYFGNRVSYFEIQTPHRALTVTARSTLTVEAAPPLPDSPPWRQTAAILGDAAGDPGFDLAAREFTLASPLVVLDDPALAAFARPSFPPERPLLEAVADLNRRIYTEFRYDPAFSTVATPLAEVLEHRRGVCQDFAHLLIACLRALGLAARYVSGYLETLPPPGQPKLTGSDASHAWASVYLPGHGWFDFDPTNNQRPDRQYVTTAWGRDYGDVTPLKGVIFGGGRHQLEVAVDVERLD